MAKAVKTIIHCIKVAIIAGQGVDGAWWRGDELKGRRGRSGVAHVGGEKAAVPFAVSEIVNTVSTPYIPALVRLLAQGQLRVFALSFSNFFVQRKALSTRAPVSLSPSGSQCWRCLLRRVDALPWYLVRSAIMLSAKSLSLTIPSLLCAVLEEYRNYVVAAVLPRDS